MTLEKVERAVKRTVHSRHLDGMEDALLGIPKEPEPGKLGWTRKHKRQAKRLGLPDPSSPRVKLHKAMGPPKAPKISSKWHRDRWKRRWNRWDRKFLGIRPSTIGLLGSSASVIPMYVMDYATYASLLGVEPSMLMLSTPPAVLGWKLAAEAVNERKRKRLARMKRRLKRARREEMGDSTPPIRERMAEPPFYTDSPAVVRDNQFKRRNRNQL